MELWDAVRDTLREAGAAACGVTAIGPSQALPGMRTAVCAAFSYLAEDRDAPICRYARGRDYHRALTEAMCRSAREKGLAFLTLEVRESNLPARRLYESCGFCTAAVRKNYYERPREDAVLMTAYFRAEE